MGLLGGLLGFGFNMAGAQQQQGYNDKMWQKQTDFIREMNEYNSPENQVKRLEEAGLNPSLMLGNISTGNGSSVPQAGTATAAQAGNFSGITDDILSLINNKNQQNLVKSQTESNFADATEKTIDSYTRGFENLARIGNILKDSGLKDSESLLNKVKADATDFLSTMQYQQGAAAVGKMAAETEMMWLNHAKGMRELQFLPVQQRLQYVEAMGRVAKMSAETETEKQKMREAIQRTNHEYFKAKGQKFLNDLDKKTEGFLIREREHRSRMSSPFEFGDIINDWWNNF